MADVNHINLLTLKSMKTDFDVERNNFINVTYSNFQSSYFFSTSNNIIRKMNNNLNKKLSEIAKSYNNIDKWWSDYNISVEELENLLSGKSNVTANLDPSIRSIVNSKLLGIDEYKNTSNLGITGYSTVEYNSTKSFNEYISINTDFSSLYAGYDERLSNLSKNVAQNSGIIDQSILDWVNNEVAPAISDFSDKVNNICISTGATIANAATGFVQGVGEFGEGLYDAGAIVSTGIKTIGTGTVDLISFGASKVFGTEFESKTAEMWEDTKAFVAKKHVKTFFEETVRGDNIYGNFLRESYFYEQTHAISSGIGYIAGVVVFTAVTFGAGGAASGLGVSQAAANATVATVAGTGRGTEKAWSEGAGITKGLVYGGMTGVWEGLQFYLGSKIQEIKVLNTPTFTTKLVNLFTRSAVDGAVGGIEGFVLPAFETVYKDGYIDENGNYIAFTDQGLFSKYSEIFDDAGGFSNVVTSAIIGSGFSAVSEIVPSIKKAKNRNPDLYKAAEVGADSVVDNIKELNTAIDIIDEIKEDIKVYDNVQIIQKNTVSNHNYISDTFKVNIGDGRGTITLENVGTLIENDNQLFKFNYNDSLGNKHTFFSDTNLTEFLKTTGETENYLIFSDFLSAKRIFTKEKAYIGSVLIEDNVVKKQIYTNKYSMIENANTYKTFDNMQGEFSSSSMKYKIEQVGSITDKGEKLNSYLIKTADFPNGRIFSSKVDLIDAMGGFSTSREFRNFLETNFLNTDYMSKGSTKLNFDFNFETGIGSNLSYLNNWKYPRAKLSEILNDELKYYDKYENMTSIKLSSSDKIGDIEYFTYKYSVPGYADEYTIITDYDFIDRFKYLSTSEKNIDSILNDVLDVEILNKISDSNAKPIVLGSLYTFGNKLEVSINSKINTDIINKIYTKKANEIDRFLSGSTSMQNYGTNQNILKQVTNIEKNLNYYNKEGERLFTKLLAQYKMSTTDSSATLHYLDSVGACSYANVVNLILSSFENKPQQFKELFGFDLYRITDTGKELNSSELLLDLYISVNSDINGGKIFTTNQDGSLSVTNSKNIDLSIDNNKFDYFNASEQQYMSNYKGYNSDIINKYLSSKSDRLSFKGNVIALGFGEEKTLTNQKFDEIIKNLKLRVLEGEKFSLGLYSSGSEVRFLDAATKETVITTKSWNEGAGHSVTVTGIDGDNFIVSTWNEKRLVPFEDLKYNAKFSLRSSKIIVR